MGDNSHKRTDISPDERARLYDELFDGRLFGLFRSTPGGRLIWCNQRLADLLGYSSAEELVSQPIERLYFDTVERERYLDVLIKQKRVASYEILLKHKDGKAVHVLENTVLRQAHDGPMVIEGAVIDITEMRRSELEQRVMVNNYRQLVERILDGVVVVQKDIVVYANRAANELLDTTQLVQAEFLRWVQEKDREELRELLRRVVNGAPPASIRAEFRPESGKSRTLLVHAITSWYMNDVAVQLTLQDMECERHSMRERLQGSTSAEVNASLRAEVEEHQRTQTALEQSRRLASSLIESSLDMIIAVDQRGHITEFNPAATLKFGYEAEEVIGSSARLLYADQGEYDRVQKEMDRYGAYAGEVRNRAKDGREFVCFLAASRLLDPEGAVIGTMGSSRDVTQSKFDREALEASEKRYRDLVDNAYDMIHSVGSDGRFTFVNEAWKRTMGYTEKELETLTLYDVIADEDDREKARRWMMDPWKREGTSIWRAAYRTSKGERIVCEGTSSVHMKEGRPVIARTIMRDITESQAYLEQIRRHAAKEKALFNASDHMFWTVERDLVITSFNKEYGDMIERLVGKRPHLELSADGIEELFRSDGQHDRWRNKYKEAFQGKKIKFEDHRIDQQGDPIIIEVFLSPVVSDDGRIEEVFGIAREITEEKRNEIRVREQGAKLKAIFENSAEVLIWSMDRKTEITACNDSFRRKIAQILGDSLEEGDQLGEPFRGLLSSSMVGSWKQVIDLTFQGNRHHRELELKAKNGATIWLELYLSPIENKGKVCEVSCLALDITNKKRTEQEIQERLHEKEILLKEVHHRVKNNLQIVSSIFNLQKDHVGHDEQCMTLLRQSQSRIRAMSVIHESLYQNKDFNQVDMVRYIQGLCGNLVMTYSLSGRIRIQTNLQPLVLDMDKAVPCGLVLNELISNSLRHAFIEHEEGAITIDLKEKGRRVEIALADNGSGFPDRYNEREHGGLGTELVHLLMGQLDGEIRRTTPENGNGTAYLITFDRT